MTNHACRRLHQQKMVEQEAARIRALSDSQRLNLDNYYKHDRDEDSEWQENPPTNETLT